MTPRFLANANHFADVPKRATGEAGSSIRMVIVDAEPANLLDTTGCDMPIKLHSELARKGIALAFARVRDPVRNVMQRAGVDAAVGAEHFYDRITDEVKAFGQVAPEKKEAH